MKYLVDQHVVKLTGRTADGGRLVEVRWRWFFKWWVREFDVQPLDKMRVR